MPYSKHLGSNNHVNQRSEDEMGNLLDVIRTSNIDNNPGKSGFENNSEHILTVHGVFC